MRLIAIIVACLVAPAWAAPKTKVFPLVPSAGVSVELADRFTRAIARSIEAEVATVPIEDAAGLLDCDIASTLCLDSVARSVAATRLVFGAVVRKADKLEVTLTRFDGGPDRRQRTYLLAATTDEALADELVRASGELFDRAPVVSPTPVPTPTPTPVQPIDTQERGSIRASTWILLGGGLVAAGVGTGFLISARGIREDVEAAPTDTVEDFRRLVELEDKGTLHTRLGQGLLVVGGVALAVGVWRVIVDRSRRDNERRVTLVPLALPDGGGLALTWGAL